MKARPLAVRILKEVLNKGRSLSTALPTNLPKADEGERALCQELCYGTLRYYLRLSALAEQLLSKPLKAKDLDVQLLILMGLYQLLYMRLPEHAAVSETVKVVQSLKKPWAKGLVNAVLRRLQREKETLLAKLDTSPISQYSQPQWIIDSLQQHWPEHWQAILSASNQHPPMTLRVNARQGQRDPYLDQLKDIDPAAVAAPHTAHGITLSKALNVTRLPGFEAGAVSVQDSAAQLAAELLPVEPGQRV
ncbi:MAG: 16S rRNA (cytosine(967)-C(5))-methyltransferase, partial [Gammaproteobacteria bacterium]|nr:16S rRNA (cytosine(967)-C(5))-methyltransferase [Gammaproteobacteria bacterium]